MNFSENEACDIESKSGIVLYIIGEVVAICEQKYSQ